VDQDTARRRIRHLREKALSTTFPEEAGALRQKAAELEARYRPDVAPPRHPTDALRQDVADSLSDDEALAGFARAVVRARGPLSDLNHITVTVTMATGQVHTTRWSRRR
jgi:Protein of unknown function (DUF2786)